MTQDKRAVPDELAVAQDAYREGDTPRLGAPYRPARDAL
jgi:hypothetical protein